MKFKLRKSWYLGFLGVLSVLGIKGVEHNDWMEMMWFLWILWFIHFIPVRDRQNCHYSSDEPLILRTNKEAFPCTNTSSE